MNRSTLLLIGLLAVLGAVVYLVLPSGEEQMASYTKPVLSFEVDSAAVIGVEIRRPQGGVNIQNIGGRWTITSPAEYPADPAAVSQLIGSFSRFRAGSLISDNPGKQGLFQVDSTGTLVTLTERSGGSHSIIIGKMGPSFSEVYFRLPDRSDVYLGSGITTWSLNKEVGDWRDRTIYAAPAEAITGVSVSVGERTRSFARDSAGWRSEGTPVGNETINPLLTTLSGLRADDFIDSAVAFSGAPATVKVAGASEATLSFYRLASDTSKYAVQSSASPQKYIVSSGTASQLLGTAGLPAATAASRPPRREPPARSATPVVTEKAPAAKPVEKKESVVPPPPVRTRQEEPARTETKPETVNPFKQKSANEERPTIAPSKQPGGGGTGQTPVRQPETGPPVRKPEARPPARQPEVKPPAVRETQAPVKAADQGALEDEGELTIHVVKRGETMTSIASQYGVSVEQILEWNLLKSISVKPGQELYVFVRK